MSGDRYWLDAHAELVDVHREKSGGYGTGADPLANFTAVAAVTGEPAFLYPCRRAIEKLTRVESLVAQGRFGELEEEFKDVSSLALCAEALRRRMDPDDSRSSPAGDALNIQRSRLCSDPGCEICKGLGCS